MTPENDTYIRLISWKFFCGSCSCSILAIINKFSDLWQGCWSIRVSIVSWNSSPECILYKRRIQIVILWDFLKEKERMRGKFIMYQTTQTSSSVSMVYSENHKVRCSSLKKKKNINHFPMVANWIVVMHIKPKTHLISNFLTTNQQHAYSRSPQKLIRKAILHKPGRI